MTPLASAISGALIHFVWQGSIVGLSLWAVLFALRKRSANARYAAACVALAVMAVLPVVTGWLLFAGSGERTRSPVAGWQTVSAAAASNGVHAAQWMDRFQSWALPVWSLGVLAFSLRLALGYRHAFQLRRRGKPAGEAALEVVRRLQKIMGVARPIRVLMSTMSDSPSAIGWIRPVILLPAATLMGLTPMQLEAVLAHEIGHIKRYDYLVNMLQMMVETLLFYHPAVWWTSRTIRAERELCCDDLAVRFSGNALRYARALTVLEKIRLKTPTAVMASTGGSLLFRIQRLVGVSPRDYGPSRLPALIAVVIGVTCFALNVSWTHGQDAPGVKVDLGASAIIHRTPVRYPEAALKQGITGTVQLEVTLDSSGNVADARVLSGPAELRRASLESVLSWHFSSDAAGATRLVTISFATNGTQIQVAEPRREPRNREQEIEFTKLRAIQRNAELDAAKRAVVEEAARASQETVTTRQFLEREARATREKLQSPYASEEDRKILERTLQELVAKLDGIPLPNGGGRRGNPYVDRVLKSITAPDMSSAVQNDLIARLPVRVGDTLSGALLEQIAAAVRSYDEHLRVQFALTTDGQVELRITAQR